MSPLHGRSLEMKQGEREVQPSPGAQTGRLPGLKGCLVSRWEKEKHGLSWERQKRVRPEFRLQGAGRKERGGAPGNSGSPDLPSFLLEATRTALQLSEATVHRQQAAAFPRKDELEI